MISFIKKILTFNGISIFIGLSGGIASISALFLDLNSQVSIKWLIFLLFISSIIIVTLIKIVYDVYHVYSTSKTILNIRPINYIPKREILLISNEYGFPMNTSLSLYLEEDNVEVLLGLGVVLNIQEKFTQVEIKFIIEEFKEDSIRKKNNLMMNIVLKNQIPYSGIMELLEK